jgi:hypothetical protein
MRCPKNHVMRKWRLVPDGNQMKVNFKCSEAKLGLTNCEVIKTGSNDWGGGIAGKTEYLDRHNVACPASKYMTQWRLFRPAGDKISIEYTCCGVNFPPKDQPEPVSALDQVKFLTIQGTNRFDCKAVDWSDSMSKQGWSECPTGYYLTGLYRESPEASIVGQKVNFGKPGTNDQDGWVTIGPGDGKAGSFEGKFPLGRKKITVAVSGYTHTRMDYQAAEGGPQKPLSDMLRSAFLCNTQQCTITMTVSGLKKGLKYLVKTWHHDTIHTRGGAKFTAEWKGKDLLAAKTLKQSNRPQDPAPALSYQAEVIADDSGTITLTMTRLPEGSAADAHMNLNGLEITQEATPMGLSKITKAYCCKAESLAAEWGTCYDQALTEPYGWVECGTKDNRATAITALYRDASESLTSMNKAKCCSLPQKTKAKLFMKQEANVNIPVSQEEVQAISDADVHVNSTKVAQALDMFNATSVAV